MSDETDTFDLYLVQDPRSIFEDPHNTLRGQLTNLLEYFVFSYRPTQVVSNLQDFSSKVLHLAQRRGKKIKTLVIAGHGSSRHFDIGYEHVGLDPDYVGNIPKMGLIAPVLDKDADVYILACLTGNDENLLRQVSKALGGVRVHGFTDYIRTENYFVATTLDDGVNDEFGGHEVVCLTNKCSVARQDGRIAGSATTFFDFGSGLRPGRYHRGRAAEFAPEDEATDMAIFLALSRAFSDEATASATLEDAAPTPLRKPAESKGDGGMNALADSQHREAYSMERVLYLK